jgi:hypothetical protein
MCRKGCINMYFVNCATVKQRIPFKIFHWSFIYSRTLNKYFRDFRRRPSIVQRGEAEVHQDHVTDRTSTKLGFASVSLLSLPPSTTTTTPPNRHRPSRLTKGPSLTSKRGPDGPSVLRTAASRAPTRPRHTRHRTRAKASGNGGRGEQPARSDGELRAAPGAYAIFFSFFVLLICFTFL